MTRFWGTFLFLLSSVAVLLGVLLQEGVPVRKWSPLQVSTNPQGMLTAHLRTALDRARVLQDGVPLEGPYGSIIDLEHTPNGSFVGKGVHLYFKPLTGRPATFALGAPYEVPAWLLPVASTLAALGLLLAFLGKWEVAASIEPGRKVPPLDGLRGCACLMVVFFHLIWAFMLKEPLQGEVLENFVTPFPWGLFSGGTFCVHVFFVLSGFVLSLPYLRMEATLSGAKLRAAIVRRPFRLLGVLLPVLVAAYLLGYGPREPGIFLSDLLTSPFVRGQAYLPPLWTLWQELYGSVALFIGLWLVQGLGFRWRMLVYVWGAVMLHNTDFIDFLAGAALAEGAASGVFPLRSATSIALASLATVGGLWLASFTNDFGTNQNFAGGPAELFAWFAPLKSWAAALVVFGALNVASFQRFLNFPWVQFLGRISYSLYVIHWIAIYSIAYPLVIWLKSKIDLSTEAARFFPWTETIWAIATAACFTFGIFIAWMMTRWIDNPAIRLSKRIANIILRRPFDASPESRNEMGIQESMSNIRGPHAASGSDT